MTVAGYLEERFHLRSRESSVPQEVAAGISTFLTMSYVLLLNPLLLAKLGLDSNAVVLSTAIASSAASFIAGYFGNLPFGSAPGEYLRMVTIQQFIHIG